MADIFKPYQGCNLEFRIMGQHNQPKHAVLGYSKSDQNTHTPAKVSPVTSFPYVLFNNRSVFQPVSGPPKLKEAIDVAIGNVLRNPH